MYKMLIKKYANRVLKLPQTNKGKACLSKSYKYSLIGGHNTEYSNKHVNTNSWQGHNKCSG